MHGSTFDVLRMKAFHDPPPLPSTKDNTSSKLREDQNTDSYMTKDHESSEDSNDSNCVDDKERQCLECNRTHTPLWRRGPRGSGTLCNACGVKWNKRLKLQQQHDINDDMSPADDNALEKDVQEKGSSVVSEVKSTTILEDTTKHQITDQKARNTNFIAPLKKRRVILE